MTDRELDALVAEKVTGWTDIYRDPWDDGEKSYGIPPSGGVPEAHPKIVIPRYSTTGDGMLAVIEAMREKGWTVSIHEKQKLRSSEPTVRIVRFSTHINPMRGVDVEEGSGSLPRAVALAALKALGVEVDG